MLSGRRSLIRTFAQAARASSPRSLVWPAIGASFAVGTAVANTTHCFFSSESPKKEVIHTNEAPSAIGPYSQAIKYGNVLYVSGQIGLNPSTMEFVSNTDVEAQAEQALQNLGAILKAGGSSFDQCLKCGVYLANMDDFAKVNAIYTKYFNTGVPARACIAAKTLPKGALFEIDAVAAC